jgi:lysophospholipase L1-like esterase
MDNVTTRIIFASLLSVVVSLAQSGAASSSIARRGNTAMVLGDSLAGGFSADEPFPNTLPVWFAQAVIESRSAIRYLGNAGILANSTQNMLARLQTDVISMNPDKVFILAGYSDVLTPVSQTIANISSMVDQMMAAGIQPILCTLPPTPPVDIPLGIPNPDVVRINLGLRSLAELRGIPLVDFYSLLVDPATGLYKAGYSADGYHPQMPATKLMAQLAISTTRNIFDPVYPWLPDTVADPDGINMIQDALFSQSPSLWTEATVFGSVDIQPAIGPDPAILGNIMTLTKTDAASGNTLSGATITTGFRTGDKLAFVGRIRSANCEAGGMLFDVGLVFSNIGVGPLGNRNNTHPIYHWSVDVQDGQWYMEFTVPPPLDPSLPVTITPVVELESGGTGTVTVGQIGLMNLTALGF